MTGKYNQSVCRRRVNRSRRRRGEKRMQTAVTLTVILMASLLLNGFKISRFSSAEIMSGKNRQTNRQTNRVPDIPDKDTPWYLTLVNSQNHIPEDYHPKLVQVKGGEQIDERIYDPLMEMLEAAKESNLNQLPRVVSGYRTTDLQQSFYDDKIAEFKREGYHENEAVELAGQWVAAPGYSEHQIGLAVDINGVTYDVYTWLMENSYKYGFIFRYPGNKTQITNVAEEVWHYRYVGVEAATQMYEQGLCLEEYLL